MNNKVLALLGLLVTGSLIFGIVAGEDKNAPIQVAQSQTSQTQTAKKHVPRTRDLVFKSSPYKPRNLQLNLDFEDEEVKSRNDPKGLTDRLLLQTPDGKAVAVNIFYEGGKSSDRGAYIATDPKNNKNHVLHYKLTNAVIPGSKKGNFKARIQMDLYEISETSIFQRYRLYLHPDLEHYRQNPKANGWFTINELWMGAKWKNHPYPFRIGINIAKSAGAGKPLHFTVHGDVETGGVNRKGYWKEIWGWANHGFEIPVGEWLDIEVGYKQGNKKSGRFYLGAKREMDKQFTTIFDLIDWTYHPDSPKPVPMTNWNPLKVYTNSGVVNFIKKRKGATQMYFDDLEIYTDW